MSKKTSSGIREAIIALYKKDVPKKEIASLLSINRNTVTLWIKRYETEGNVKHKWRQHSPRCTSEADDQRIVDYVMNTPKALTTCPAIKANLALNCSLGTIRRRMKENNILPQGPPRKTKKKANDPNNPTKKSRKPRKKKAKAKAANQESGNSGDSNIEQGVAYALDYLCNDDTFWKKVKYYSILQLSSP